jgi:hypothetical protein
VKFDPGEGMLVVILAMFCLIAVGVLVRYVALPIVTGG